MKLVVQNPEPAPEGESGPQQRFSSYALELNRREFIAAGGIISITALLAAAARAPDLKKLTEKSMSERLLTELPHNNRSLLRTIMETVAFSAVTSAMSSYLRKLGFELGACAVNGDSYQEECEKHPIRSELTSSVFIPICEEAIFRLFPSSYLDRQSPVKMYWEVGIASNVVFAVIHNFSKDDDNKYHFSLTSLPLQQFTLGIFCWYLQRKGGFLHACLAHVLNNILVGLPAWNDQLEQSENSGENEQK